MLTDTVFAHFRHQPWHRATSHPIIRSLESGEDWSWCYLDEFAFIL
jgi:hypothetical protein